MVNMERVKLYEIVEREVVTTDPTRLRIMGAYPTTSLTAVRDEDTVAFSTTDYVIPVDRVVSRVEKGSHNVHYHDQLVAIHPDVLNVIAVVQQGRIDSLQSSATRAEEGNKRLRENLSKCGDRIREHFASLPLYKRILLALLPYKYAHLLK